jgi:hypothetical protein
MDPRPSVLAWSVHPEVVNTQTLAIDYCHLGVPPRTGRGPFGPFRQDCQTLSIKRT